MRFIIVAYVDMLLPQVYAVSRCQCVPTKSLTGLLASSCEDYLNTRFFFLVPLCAIELSSAELSSVELSSAELSSVELPSVKYLTTEQRLMLYL